MNSNIWSFLLETSLTCWVSVARDVIEQLAKLCDYSPIDFVKNIRPGAATLTILKILLKHYILFSYSLTFAGQVYYILDSLGFIHLHSVHSGFTAEQLLQMCFNSFVLECLTREWLISSQLYRACKYVVVKYIYIRNDVFNIFKA